MRALRQLLQFPPSKLWRLLVYNPQPGQDLYEQFKNQYNSLQGMTRGLQFVINTWAEPLTSGYLVKLHDVAITDVFTANTIPIPHGWRQQPVHIELTQETLTPAGLAELLAQLDSRDETYFSMQQGNPPTPVNIRNPGRDMHQNESFYTQRAEECYSTLLKNTLSICPILCGGTLVGAIDNIITRFFDSIRAHPDKLFCIAKLIHELELAHGFENGNCRTHAVLLLIKLLIQYDQNLGFLENPNIIKGHSIGQIMWAIKKGQQMVSNVLSFGHSVQISDEAPILLTAPVPTRYHCTIL